MVAAGVVPSPFDHVDVVSTTTHKSLRGPRAGMIFYRKGVKHVDPKTKAEVKYTYEQDIDFAVFPSLQGGPHENAVAGIATMAFQAGLPDFRKYQIEVMRNAKALASALQELGYTVVSGGTDTHVMLVDLRPKQMDGARAERVCELCAITLNKNTVPGDKSALTPGGLRLGTPALTTRGFSEEDFKKVAAFIDRAIQIAHGAKKKTKNLKTFKQSLLEDEEIVKQIESLKTEVESFAGKFDMPGWEDF